MSRLVALSIARTLQKNRLGRIRRCKVWRYHPVVRFSCPSGVPLLRRLGRSRSAGDTLEGAWTAHGWIWHTVRAAGDVGKLWIVGLWEYTKWRRGPPGCPVVRVISTGRMDFRGIGGGSAVHRLSTRAICGVHNLCTRKKKRAQPLCPTVPRSSGKECCRNLCCVPAVSRNNSTQYCSVFVRTDSVPSALYLSLRGPVRRSFERP